MKKDRFSSAITTATLTILAVLLVGSVVYQYAVGGKEEGKSEATVSEKDTPVGKPSSNGQSETPIVTQSSGRKSELHLSPAFPDNRAGADSSRVESGQPITIVQDPRNVAPGGSPIPIEGGRPPATSGNSAEFFSGGNSASGQGGQRTRTGGFTQQSGPGFESAPREGDRLISSMTLGPGEDPLCLESLKAIEAARRIVHCSMIRECRDFPGVVFDEERVWSRINGLPDVGPEVGAEIIINNTAAVTVDHVEAHPVGGNFDPTQPGVIIVVKITAVAFGSGDTSCRREATHEINPLKPGGK